MPYSEMKAEDMVVVDPTGKVIEEVISDPLAVPAAIVENHGAFTFAKTPKAALEYAITLEEVAKPTHLTEAINK